MASDSNLHRRVRRLENETESIHGLITEMRSTQLAHGEHLDEMRATLGGVQPTLTEVLRRLPEPA